MRCRHPTGRLEVESMPDRGDSGIDAHGGKAGAQKRSSGTSRRRNCLLSRAGLSVLFCAAAAVAAASMCFQNHPA